ncbi:2-isopropylmalate synthase [Thermosulfuriphilus ammonigenes]|uniref:2-isopropylmalate synthase n=1 Tax=Thermosulfuriphilus ammonigenes TaxID=1936021 RepID=A0A6G7PTH4_9BACT|nr:2-isopropylmalate synthase [Thermosulfuriphilus ammonigenes]MBA2848897.1 2-isopropylmalate synthase [Thermosulfuriphilus ammonigenes]QIJ70985.1 2-isopropylmalate synthase [Thermosulfuriphilus ammonigenes]
MSERVYIFDTTLRDGEQSPGVSLNVEEKLRIAQQLERLKVDVIEAGFPVASPGDFEAVKRIADEVRGLEVAALARANQRDIDTAWEAIKRAASPRIHTFIATSDIHLKYKLRKSREEVLELAVSAVKHASSYTSNVEFSAEDATRSDLAFLAQVVEAVIEAGARVVNIPDTVGYTVPHEYERIISYLKEHVANIDRAIISVHCHNDLGLAVANSVAAIRAGARQIECTINGIGERAGNAAMEEIVMILRTRQDVFPYHTEINTRQIVPTSRLVSHLTGMVVQPNKAIVGANAFAHESGIHQDGVLKERSTYEIMSPEDVGWSKSAIVLGKHSGRHALKAKLEELGYHLADEELDRVFRRFKELADKKQEIFDEDIEAIVADEVFRLPDKYELKYLNVISGTTTIPTAMVEVSIEGQGTKRLAGFGVGPIDAAYNVLAQITGTASRLLRFSVTSITGGTDAQGEVTVRLEEGGQVVMGQGADSDIIVAAAKAYLNALNRLERLKKKNERQVQGMCPAKV